MSARELITEHLGLWTVAVTKKSSSGRGRNGKVELTGVKKLRELILELAVRGRLVEQDPTDEPASMLLEQVNLEKIQLAKQGKIKKPKRLPEIEEEEKPFNLPEGWQWARMEAISEYIQRGKGPKYAESGKVRVVSQKCVQWSGFDLEAARFVDDSSLDGYQKERYIRENDVLWNSTGTGTVGRAIVIEQQQNSLVADSHVTIIRPLISEPRHILNYILSPSVQQRIEPDHENSLVSGTTKQVELNSSSVKMLAVPLPPLNEQHRIVQKVDELMALCDRLEQQTSDQLEAHQTLVDTLLGTLTQSENATELADNWARLATHFDTLFTTEQSIDKLKQTILQLAVMGRLVEQDAGDEPGSALVARMLETRDHLATNEGMKTKAGNEVPSNEMYLSLPNSWAWVRLGNMAKFIDYRGKTPTKTGSGKRLITAKNIRQGYIDLEPEEFISEEDYTKWMTRGFPRKGDLLFTPEAPLGNAAIVDLNEEFALAQRAICFQWHHLDTSRFMLIQIMASPFQTKLVENATGMTATGIKASKLKEIPVAIPPLKEQHRIVQKVDELTALCDQLKERLSQASETRNQLAEAVVQGALN